MLTILCHITQCKRLMLKSGIRDSAIAQENVMLKVYISMRSILLHFRQVFSLPSRSAAKVVGATLMLSLLVAGGMIFAQSRRDRSRHLQLPADVLPEDGHGE